MELEDPQDIEFADGPPSFWAGLLMKFAVYSFFAALLGVVIGLFYLKNRGNLDGDDDTRNRPAVKVFDDVLDQGTVGELREYSNQLSVRLEKAVLPKKIELLTQRVQIADRIMELSEEDRDREYAHVSKIKSLLKMNDLNTQFDLPRESTVQRILDATAVGLESGLEQVESLARLGNILVSVLNYDHEDTTAQEVVDVIDASANSISTKEEDGTRLLNLCTYLSGKELTEGHEIIVSRIAEVLLQSDSPQIVEMGIQAQGGLLNGLYGVTKLLQADELDAEQRKTVTQLVERITRYPRLPTANYLTAVVLIEKLYRTDNVQLAQKLVEQLQLKVNDITQEKVKTNVQNILDSHRQRVAAKGQVLKIEAIDALDQMQTADDFRGKPTAILFFSNTAADSIRYLDAVNSLTYLKPRGIRLVVIAVHTDDREALVPIANRYSSLIWFSNKEANSILKQVPLSRLPYLIVVDGEGKIASINVGLNSLRSELEKLL